MRPLEGSPIMSARRRLDDELDHARRGDKAALAHLYVAYRDLVSDVAQYVLGNREDAEDLTHDIFLNLRLHLGQFSYRGRPGFEAWLRRVTIRAAFRVQERRRRRSTLLSERYPRGMVVRADSWHLPDLRVDLEAAMSSLPADRRQVVLLHDLHALSHAEIAARLGIREATSRSRLKRARRVLRACLSRR